MKFKDLTDGASFRIGSCAYRKMFGKGINLAKQLPDGSWYRSEDNTRFKVDPEQEVELGNLRLEWVRAYEAETA